MTIFKKTAVVLVSGFLMVGFGIAAQASVSTSTTIGGLTFVPLTPEAAAQLPPWIKPGDVVGMSAEVAPVPQRSGTDLAAMEPKEKAQLQLKRWAAKG
jgi:hypothetical protein